MAIHSPMRPLKALLTFALCLILLATSVTQAIARGQMAGGQMVQLCAGGKAVTVMTDAAGTPVDASPPCPECVAVTASLPPTARDMGRTAGCRVRLSPPVLAQPVARRQFCASARGPPVLI